MKGKIMNTRSDNLLENLDEKTRVSILELAANADLTDVVVRLQERGISVSVSTLSRFVRRHREKLMLSEGSEMKGAVDQFVERGKEGGLRAGTLEAVRQRLYERALESRSPEEARLLYAALVKEEAKLKELELEGRRVALAEEQLKLDVLVARSKVGGRVKGEVVDGAVGEKGSELVIDERAKLQLGGPMGPTEKETRLLALVSEVDGILNRGGDLGERLLEARAVLAEGVKEMPRENDK
jgi:hypothetical protein